MPWLLPGWARAQVWWNVILVKRGLALTAGLLAHELAHVLQWRSLGVFGFMYHYARSFLRHGYENHPLEMTARLAEQDDFFLKWAQEILRSRKSLSSNPAATRQGPVTGVGTGIVNPHKSV